MARINKSFDKGIPVAEWMFENAMTENDIRNGKLEILAAGWGIDVWALHVCRNSDAWMEEIVSCVWYDTDNGTYTVYVEN